MNIVKSGTPMNLSMLVGISLMMLFGARPLNAGGFEIGNGVFLLNGKPFQIVSGEMHYSRIPPEYWRDRLIKARAMGLNTVATYVFWNVQEPRPGVFDFSGAADVARFVKIAQEEGLYVILRPGPYACAEWEFGGFPSWLLKNHTLTVRSKDGRFLSACKSYLLHLGEQLAPLQIDRGGPIIMVQVENEYGSFGSDKEYLASVRDMIHAAGFDVPLFAADGPSQMPNSVLPNVLPGVNGAVGQEIFDSVRRFRPQGPFFVPEFYPGWLDHWGEPHAQVNADTCARDLDWILSRGISVNLYMFHGGTNFGFMNGANFGGHYQPQPTSYDYDAPLDEAGGPTAKYMKFREVIARSLPHGSRIPDVPPSPPRIGIPRIRLGESAGLFDNLHPPIPSTVPLAMEDVDQAYGYILYRTRIDSSFVAGRTGVRATLAVNGLRDYAVVLLNGVVAGELDRRDRGRALTLSIDHLPVRLDILVENGGRINYGSQMLDNRKGITGHVTLDGGELGPWEIFPLPMDKPASFRFRTGGDTPAPALYRGTVQLKETGDTFLDMRRWGKGCVWVNGHNLGRFWYIGPQQTLYLPGVWLREGDNEIVVLDLEGGGERTIQGLTEPILNELVHDRLQKPLPQRSPAAVSLDAADLVRKGAFAPGDSALTVRFPAVAGRFVCLESLSSQAGDPFASIAELFVLDDRGVDLPRESWSVVAVDCEELTAEDGRAENAIDNDTETIWHTLWGSSRPGHPHMIVLDLGGSHAIGGFRYLPRHGDAPGKIKDFRFYVRKTPFQITR